MKLKTFALALLTFPLLSFSDVKPTPVDVNILSWNVFMLPKPLKFSIQKDRTRIIIQRLLGVEHDVIILQEAFAKDFRKKVAAGLAEKFPYQVQLGKSSNWKQVMPSGVMAFSRYPMRMITNDFYNWCTKADCYSSKGVMFIEVELPRGKKIHIAGTHLNSGRTQVSVDVRETQIEQIKNLARTFNHNEETAGIPMILAGDLNIEAYTPEFEKTIQTLGMNTIPLENPEVPSSNYPVPCYKRVDNPRPRWIDHILLDPRSTRTEQLSMKVRPFFGTLKGIECALSDHQAVEAKIRIYE